MQIYLMGTSDHKRAVRKLLVPMTPMDWMLSALGVLLVLSPWLVAGVVVALAIR